jgi:hypothetical protein
MLRLCLNWHAGTLQVAVRPRVSRWHTPLLIGSIVALCLHLLPFVVIRPPPPPLPIETAVKPILVRADHTSIPTPHSNTDPELLQLLEKLSPHNLLPPLPPLEEE